MGRSIDQVTRNYELTFIVKPDVDATNLTTVLDRVKDVITAEGGSIVKVDQWGMRRLMYPIRKYREGQYVFELVQLEANSVSRIEARLRLMEDVVRYLLVRADDNTPAAAPEAQPAPQSVAEQSATTPVEPEAVPQATPAAPDTTASQADASTAEGSPESTTP